MEDAFLVDAPGIAPEPVFDLVMQYRPAAAMIISYWREILSPSILPVLTGM